MCGHKGAFGVMSKVFLVLCLAAGGLLLVPPATSAGALPTAFTQTTYASGLGSHVTAMDFAPDGRLFVATQEGAVRIVKDGVLQPTPFLTLSTAYSGERGLTGLTLDPDFAQNHFVYVYYALQGTEVHNRVSRFVAVGDVAQSVAGVPTETVLIDLDNGAGTTHQSGVLDFGADGKLYIGAGDNLVRDNAQTIDSTSGKLLRINRDGTIPDDNPFADTATGARRAIWALGLRNPWSIDVQPGSGRMFVADVGESTWEEIDEVVTGGNYGWPVTEGVAGDPTYVDPVYAYAHSGDGVTGCAITGGAFYSPTTVSYPDDYVGDYFFADFCGGWIKRYDAASGTVTGFADGATASVVDLDVGPDGNLYYLSRATNNSTVTKISYSGDLAPRATITSPTIGGTYAGGQTISFAGSGTDTDDGDLPASALTWRVDRIHDGQADQVVAPTSGVTSGSFDVPQDGYGDGSATYRITLTAIDSYGRPGTTSVDVTPRLVQLKLDSSLAGLKLTLDGREVTSPATVDSVVGVRRTLGVVSPQAVNGTSYEFQSWSDGGVATHVVTTPTAGATYTAGFTTAPTAPLTVQFNPTADSYAGASTPTSNYGTSTSLSARGGTTAPAVTYLRFKLPRPPAGKKLTSATLRLHTTTRSSAGSRFTQKITLADDTWTETGLTWRNRPAIRGSIGTVVANTRVNAFATTTLSTVELASRLGTTFSVAVVGGGDDDFWFGSRNDGASYNRPVLTLTYG